MAKRPSSSQDCHFECTYKNIGRSELKRFITLLPPMCETNPFFDVIIQGGMDEDADYVQFDFNAKWYGITYDKLKKMINELPFDILNISIVSCKDCSGSKKQKVDVDLTKKSVMFPDPAVRSTRTDSFRFPDPPIQPTRTDSFRFPDPSSFRLTSNTGPTQPSQLPPFRFIRFGSESKNEQIPGLYDAFGPLAEHELMKFVRESSEDSV